MLLNMFDDKIYFFLSFKFFIKFRLASTLRNIFNKYNKLTYR